MEIIYLAKLADLPSSVQKTDRVKFWSNAICTGVVLIKQSTIWQEDEASASKTMENQISKELGHILTAKHILTLLGPGAGQPRSG